MRINEQNIRRCPVCMRTRDQAIGEQVASGESCGHPQCAFRQEIEFRVHGTRTPDPPPGPRQTPNPDRNTGQPPNPPPRTPPIRIEDVEEPEHDPDLFIREPITTRGFDDDFYTPRRRRGNLWWEYLSNILKVLVSVIKIIFLAFRYLLSREAPHQPIPRILVIGLALILVGEIFGPMVNREPSSGSEAINNTSAAVESDMDNSSQSTSPSQESSNSNGPVGRVSDYLQEANDNLTRELDKANDELKRGLEKSNNTLDELLSSSGDHERIFGDHQEASPGSESEDYNAENTTQKDGNSSQKPSSTQAEVYPPESGKGLYLVKQGEKIYFKKPNGKKMTHTDFDAARPFDHERAAVKKNGKWGFIDSEGELVIPFKYDTVRNFYTNVWKKEDWAEVWYYGNRLLIDNDGNIMKGAPESKIFTVQKNAKYTFVDFSGYRITDKWFNDAGQFSHGMARVKRNGQWGYINAEGDLVIDFMFNEARDFSTNIWNGDIQAAVRKNGDLLFIDKTGNRK